MKKSMAILFIACLLLTSFVAAELSLTIEEGTELPGPLKVLFSDDQAEVHLTFIDGTEQVFSVVTVNGKVTSFMEGSLVDPTIRIYVHEQTLRDIEQSNDPLAVLTTALQNGDIRYEATTFPVKVKLWFSKVVLRFFP